MDHQGHLWSKWTTREGAITFPMKSEQYFFKPVEINKYSSKEPVEIKN
jgi:hypothetical protein